MGRLLCHAGLHPDGDTLPLSEPVPYSPRLRHKVERACGEAAVRPVVEEALQQIGYNTERALLEPFRNAITPADEELAQEFIAVPAKGDATGDIDITFDDELEQPSSVLFGSANAAAAQRADDIVALQRDIELHTPPAELNPQTQELVQLGLRYLVARDDNVPAWEVDVAKQLLTLKHETRAARLNEFKAAIVVGSAAVSSVVSFL